MSSVPSVTIIAFLARHTFPASGYLFIFIFLLPSKSNMNVMPRAHKQKATRARQSITTVRLPAPKQITTLICREDPLGNSLFVISQRNAHRYLDKVIYTANLSKWQWLNNGR